MWNELELHMNVHSPVSLNQCESHQFCKSEKLHQSTQRYRSLFVHQEKDSSQQRLNTFKLILHFMFSTFCCEHRIVKFGVLKFGNYSILHPNLLKLSMNDRTTRDKDFLNVFIYEEAFSCVSCCATSYFTQSCVVNGNNNNNCFESISTIWTFKTRSVSFKAQHHKDRKEESETYTHRSVNHKPHDLLT